MEIRVRYVANSVRRPPVHATTLLWEGGADGRERGLRRVVAAEERVIFFCNFPFPETISYWIKSPTTMLWLGRGNPKTEIASELFLLLRFAFSSRVALPAHFFEKPKFVARGGGGWRGEKLVVTCISRNRVLWKSSNLPRGWIRGKYSSNLGEKQDVPCKLNSQRNQLYFVLIHMCTEKANVATPTRTGQESLWNA